MSRSTSAVALRKTDDPDVVRLNLGADFKQAVILALADRLATDPEALARFEDLLDASPDLSDDSNARRYRYEAARDVLRRVDGDDLLDAYLPRDVALNAAEDLKAACVPVPTW